MEPPGWIIAVTPASAGDKVANTGKQFFHVENGSGGSITATVVPVVTTVVDPQLGTLKKENAVLSLAAGEEGFLGPFETAAFNDTDGNISLDEPRERTLRVTHIVGEQYGALYGTYFNRDDQGRIIHEMSQGYPRPSLNTGRKILGFGVPPQQLGIGASFRYKDFNASFLVEGKSGGQIFSGTNVRLIGYGLHQMKLPNIPLENYFLYNQNQVYLVSLVLNIK